MDVPKWADESYSEELTILRAHGEGPKLEYMAEFPSNATELAKEIAAFASTDGGTILLGVADSGELEGLGNLEDLAARDALMRRLEGVCHGQIKPSITPAARYAVEEGEVVLVIHVPRGEQPVYYCHGKPYVRHLTQSRPAEPHEVIERVAYYLAARASIATDATRDGEPVGEHSDFLSELAMVLRDLLLWCDQADERPVNPGLRDLIFRNELAAEQLRVLASLDSAERLDFAQSIGALGDMADAVVHHQQTLGRESREAFLGKVGAVRDGAAALWDQALSDVPLSASSQEQARETLKQLSRQLRDLNERAEQSIEEGRLTELQARVSALGRKVAELSYLGLGDEDQDWTAEIRSIGRQLHLAEMIRFTMGGPEITNLLRLLKESSKQFSDLTSEL